MNKEDKEKPINWVGTSLNDLKSFPVEVQQTFGFELHMVQHGEMPKSAKALKGISGVYELKESHDGNAYRTVYIAKLKGAIYVLHCFQKKSKSGISTPKGDIDLIVDRLRMAKDYSKGENDDK